MGETIPLSHLRSGPFISGTTHAVLRLGQRLRGGEEATLDTFNAEEDVEGARKEKVQPQKRGRGGTTLRALVDGGVISPGRDNITVTYKGITYTGSLQRDGNILHQGQKFSSATAFSIHCKRLQTPNKQGDDGWKSVLYEGTPLDTFRRKLQASSKPATAVTAEMGGAEPEVGEIEAGQAAAAAGESTDQWVQCDRCRTWRVVPPEHWPAVEADERDEWLCEFAAWDVAQYPPNKPSCAKQ